MNNLMAKDVLLVVGIFFVSCMVLALIFNVVKLAKKAIKIKKEIRNISNAFEKMLSAIGFNVEFALRIDDTIVTLLYKNPYIKYVTDKELVDKFKSIRTHSDEYRALLNGIIAEIVDIKFNIANMDSSTYEKTISESWRIFDNIAERLQKGNADIIPFARELRDSINSLADEYNDDLLKAMKLRFRGI